MPMTGIDVQDGVLVVEPDQFGFSGAVRKQFTTDDLGDLATELQPFVKTYPQPTTTHDSHVRLGIGVGIEWESEIPETDAQAIRARKRARGGK